MPLRPPRRTDVDALVAALASRDPVDRDSASARLAVVGRRALPALRRLVGNGDARADVRAAGVRVVLQIDRQEAMALAGDAASGPERSLALESVTILTQSLADEGSAEATDAALEQLTRLALNRHAAADCRQVAIDAIGQLPDAVGRPLLEALKQDGASPVAGTTSKETTVGASLLSRWTEEGRLPDAEVALRAVATEGSLVPITVLSQFLTLARERESAPDHGPAWANVRDRLHEALASRGSTIALYDLREALEATDRPATTHLLAAASIAADQTCLEAIALRWLDAARDAWLRDQLERIFRAVVVRERLRRRSAALLKLLKRHPGAGALVATAPRTLKAPPKRSQ